MLTGELNAEWPLVEPHRVRRTSSRDRAEKTAGTTIVPDRTPIWPAPPNRGHAALMIHPHSTPRDAVDTPDAVVELRDGPARKKPKTNSPKPLPPHVASPRYIYAAQGALAAALARGFSEPLPVRLWLVSQAFGEVRRRAPLLMLERPPDNLAVRLSQLLAAVEDAIEPRLLPLSPDRTKAWGNWRAGRREAVLAELRSFAERHEGKAGLEDVLAGGTASDAALNMALANVARLLLGHLERP